MTHCYNKQAVQDYHCEHVRVENCAPRSGTNLLVHVVIELQDKPWELLEVLKIFKVV